MKLAYAIQSVKQWSKSAKDGVGTNLFWLKGTDFIQGKKTTKHPDKKAGITWLCPLSITAGVWVAKPSS